MPRHSKVIFLSFCANELIVVVDPGAVEESVDEACALDSHGIFGRSGSVDSRMWSETFGGSMKH